jgi:hypothetical protein
MLRRAALILVCFDVALWALAALLLFFSESDPATKGFEQAAGLIVTVWFVLTAAPALVLALARRWPGVAVALAFAFPAGCAILFFATVRGFG